MKLGNIVRILLFPLMTCIASFAQTPVSPILQPHVTFVDGSGSPCAACQLYSYAAGTTTPKATYTDSTGMPQNTNPIILDSAGGANIWLASNAYKFILKDSLGTTIWTVDNVQGYISACSVSGCTFTGPISGTTASFPGGFTGPIGNTSPSTGVFTTVTGATVNNVTYPTTFAQLQVQVSACGSSPCTIGINNVIPVTSNYTIPSNVSLIFANGQLQPGTGITLTLNGPIQAVSYTQIFGGLGTVVGLKAVYPEWFGGTSIAQAYNSLSTSGGTIYLQTKTYTAGSFTCTIPNVQIIGSGRPSFNSGFTALTGGTIIQGTVAAVQGCSHFVLRNLGVDVGSAWVGSGNPAADAVSIFNNGQIIGATPLDGVIVDNVAALGSSLSAAFHAILVENVTNSLIHNVVAIYNQHGIVLKGTYSHIDGFYSAGHSIDSVDVKSDTYAPSHDDTVTNGTMTYLLTAGDTLGLQINSEHAGTGVPIQRVSVTNVQAFGLANSSGGAAFFVTGAETFNPAQDITFTDILVDWPGTSPTNVQCVSLIQSTQRVNIKGLDCRNVYQGVNFVSPSVGFMGQVTLTNSHFENIQTSAVLTYGNWTASNNECVSVTQNCFLNQVGNLNLGVNTVTSSGAYFNNISGTMQFDYRSYNSSTGTAVLNSSPGEVYGIGTATSGQLIVNFGVTYNGNPICIGNIVSTGSAPGTTTVPNLWIVSENSTGVTFNTSSATFAGQITYSCRGLLQ